MKAWRRGDAWITLALLVLLTPARCQPRLGPSAAAAKRDDSRSVTSQHGTGSRDPWSRDPGSRDPWSRDPGSRDSGSRDSGSTDPGSRDSGSTDPGSRDSGSRYPGARNPLNRDPGNHEPSDAASGRSRNDVIAALGDLDADVEAAVDRLVTRRLNASEASLERRLADRMQRLNQTLALAHMENLLQHLNEELAQSREQQADHADELERMRAAAATQKLELDGMRDQMVVVRFTLENLTHLVNLLVKGESGVLARRWGSGFPGTTGKPELLPSRGRRVDEGVATRSVPTATSAANGATQTSGGVFPIDCEDARERGGAMEGRGFHFPIIQPRHAPQPFKACCFVTPNASWTVIQRRIDGSVDFFRSWADYKRGFGDLEGEFWLGNDNIHQLTSQGEYQLRVEMVTWEGVQHWAEYRQFDIASEADLYRLHVVGYSGNAGNSLSSPWENDHNGQPFSTRDADHDARHYDNCAEHYRGAWWFRSCFQAHLNGVYYPRGAHSNFFVRNGVQWNSIHPHSSLRDVRMMVRRNEPGEGRGGGGSEGGLEERELVANESEE